MVNSTKCNFLRAHYLMLILYLLPIGIATVLSCVCSFGSTTF